MGTGGGLRAGKWEERREEKLYVGYKIDKQNLKITKRNVIKDKEY